MTVGFVKHCSLLLFLIPLLSVVVTAQEICDNGIDDDGNGLIDLQDPACACGGITLLEDLTALIPNPSFENFSCCPTYWAQMECATGWFNLNQASPDFHHGCGFIGEPFQAAGLFPFPDGSGAGGAIFSSGWKEYMATCLNQPLQAGQTYTFRMQVASTPIAGNGDICNGGVIYYGPVAIKVFGNAQCGNLILPTLDCPSSLDLTWVELGSGVYTPSQDWSEVVMTLQPGFNVAALMLGPPCVLPPDYISAQPCYPYFLYDDLQLTAASPAPPLQIQVNGHPCAGDLSLSAWAGIPGGSWQWYFQGVALPGEQEPTLLLPESAYQPGVYTVSYTLGDECQWADVTLSFILPEPSLEEHYLCPGDTVSCAGAAFWQLGVYDVTLPSWLGCDSLIQCLILEYPSSPPQLLHIRQCGPDTLVVCGDTLTQSGLYSYTCTNVWGCDSLIDVDLALLTPVAHIQHDLLSDCDTVFQLPLNGRASTRNPHPAGITHFRWLGPPGGIQGSDTDSLAMATRPGTYCLVLTHQVDSFFCSDTVCIDLIPGTSPPAPPDVAPPAGMCYSPGATTAMAYSLSDSLAALSWNADPALLWQGMTDSTLTFSASAPGNYPVCLWTSNACGVSDTVCVTLTYLSTPLTLEQRITCDSSDIGTDTLWLNTVAGCDSLVITETLFQAAYTSLQTVFICAPGQDYLDTIQVAGTPCDSLLITHYRFKEQDTTYLQQFTCDPDLAGQSVEWLLGEAGCVSLVITNVALLPVDTLLVEGQTCRREEEAFSVETFTNQFGCDSTVMTSILYVGVDTTLILRTSCDSSQLGNYLYPYPRPGYPCDSIVQEIVTYASQSLTFLTLTVCAPDGPAADTLWLTADSGCDSLIIRQYQYSNLSAVSELRPEQCAGEEDGQVVILQVSGGAAPYRFRLNQGPWQSDTLFIGLPPGSYTLEVEDALGCSRSYPDLLIAPGAPAWVNIGSDKVVAQGSIIDLEAIGTQQLVQWQWAAWDPFSCSTCRQTSLGPISQSQTITLVAWTPEGCPARDTLQVSMTPKGKTAPVYIPNSFSPNFDGINDVFTVYPGDDILRVALLAVYDRWGNALFEGRQPSTADPVPAWDGHFRGVLLDPAVFVYVVEVVLGDGSLLLFKGDITLVR